MTAHRIEAVLFDLGGTLTAADPAPDTLNLLPQAMPCLQDLAERALPTGLLPDHKNRDSKQLRPLLDEVLDDCEALRPFPAPDRVATLAVQMKAAALRRCGAAAAMVAVMHEQQRTGPELYYRDAADRTASTRILCST